MHVTFDTIVLWDSIVLSATYRTLDQSGPRDSHSFDGLKHIDHLFYFQTLQDWVQRTECSAATKTVTEK